MTGRKFVQGYIITSLITECGEELIVNPNLRACHKSQTEIRDELQLCMLSATNLLLLLHAVSRPETKELAMCAPELTPGAVPKVSPNAAESDCLGLA